MTAPRVSIVTPARNAAPFLRETWETVRCQTFTDWEWIVVDDASEDGTAELLTAWSVADPRVRVLSRERSDGRSAPVRNLGLAAARGELIALLDADDLWLAEKLAVQVRYLDEHPEIGGVCTWYEVFGYEPWVRADHRVQRRDVVVRREHFLRGSEVKTPSLVFRRSVYLEIGGFDEDPRLAVGEDEEYFFRLTIAAGIHRLRRVLTLVRRRPPRHSLTGSYPTDGPPMKLHLADVYLEKGLVNARERRIVASQAYYHQALENLFKHHAPFRRLLLGAVRAGRPPAPALLLLALCWLPAPLMRPVLAFLQSLRRISAALEVRLDRGRGTVATSW